MTKYRYYKYDGAIFRKPADAEALGVYEIRKKAGWAPYEGDALEPVYYGTEIEEPAELA